MTDLTHVVYGRWDDVEWRQAAAKPVSQRTPAEHEIYRNGPRPHPWGPLARSVAQDDGSVLVFPNQAAADAFAGVKAPEAPVQAVAQAPEPVVVPFADPFHADPEPAAPVEPDHPVETNQ